MNKPQNCSQLFLVLIWKNSAFCFDFWGRGIFVQPKSCFLVQPFVSFLVQILNKSLKQAILNLSTKELQIQLESLLFTTIITITSILRWGFKNFPITPFRNLGKILKKTKKYTAVSSSPINDWLCISPYLLTILWYSWSLFSLATSSTSCMFLVSTPIPGRSYSCCWGRWTNEWIYDVIVAIWYCTSTVHAYYILHNNKVRIENRIIMFSLSSNLTSRYQVFS